MNNWIGEKQLMLSSWPNLLAKSPDFHPNSFPTNSYSKDIGQQLDHFESLAWACQSEQDWIRWLEKIDIHLHEQQQHRLSAILRAQTMFGPSLSQYILNRLDAKDRENQVYDHHGLKNHGLKNDAKSDGTKNHDIKNPLRAPNQLAKHIYGQEIVRLAEKIQVEFGLAALYCSKGSSPEWVRKQLTDMYMGLGVLSTLLNIPTHSIGDDQLCIWLHEHSKTSGAIGARFGQPHIELHQGGGDVARHWMLWKIARIEYAGGVGFGAPDHHNFSLKRDRLVEASSAWRRSWVKDPRQKIFHQEEFLIKSQMAFKSLVDKVPVTAELGQKLYRRYRAFCKWVDDIQRGSDLASVAAGWSKVKTGNRIAWSADQNTPYRFVIQNWIWEEKLIDAAFWNSPQWHIPAWVQRSQALAEDAWQKNWDVLEPRDMIDLWSIGFEALIQRKNNHSSWLSNAHMCHPFRQELDQFEDFFEERLRHLALD